MADDEKITVELAGRTLELRKPTAAQIMLLHRAYRATSATFDAFNAATVEAERHDLAGRGMVSAGGILDIIERLIARPDDRAWLSEQLLEGTVDLPDLLVIVRAVQDAEADEEPKEELIPKKKAVRRAASVN